MSVNQEYQLSDARLLQEIEALYRKDEEVVATALLEAAIIDPKMMLAIHDEAVHLVSALRKTRLSQGGLDAFMTQYDLSSEEGIALMCMAEALLRIPDNETIDKLIRDKLTTSDWDSHLGKSQSLFVNAATFGLMLTGKVLSPTEEKSNFFEKAFKRFASRSGEPVIRQAVRQGMKILSRQYVMGRTIDEAIDRAKASERIGYRYSYDMLGEAAYTQADADAYFKAYETAIAQIAKAASSQAGPVESPGISVKLSALHPRYEMAQKKRVMAELLPKLKQLAQQAKAANIHFTIDAEEADRLMLSLAMIEAIIQDPDFEGWDGFGFVIQAYQKRATAVVDWAISTARAHQRPLMIRLVKGAYWDTEIKNAQVDGLSGYPVFTRKVTTDVSYIACVKKLLAARDIVYPQFATHNAHTVATVMALAGDKEGYEFQCLHGMGQSLYDHIVPAEKYGIPVRIYAPVGTHEDLLAYLVRRLLENGANSSFVNRIVDEKLPVEEIVADPIAKLHRTASKSHPCIPLPVSLYGAERKNSVGVDLSDPNAFVPILKALDWQDQQLTAGPTEISGAQSHTITSPADKALVLGQVTEYPAQAVGAIIDRASAAFDSWSRLDLNERANRLEKIGDLILENQNRFAQILCHEAGKILKDSVAEIREAADFCYYYAMQARQQLMPTVLRGPTGEENRFGYEGRGVVACISPWNFPLAIFTGQIVAALVCGNTVIAKPAEQTALTGQLAIDLMHQAGIPKEALHYLPGEGPIVGPVLMEDPRVQAVMFTGSTETAKVLQKALAERPGPIVPLIAETGGQNAFIADSTALPEQLIPDVIDSAFLSAGQRCSACRVLFLQEDVADKMLTMLKGAMQELVIGHPMALSTDIGPVIDDEALAMLEAHLEKLKTMGATCIAQVPETDAMQSGHFFAPRVFEIERLEQLEREVFGPILHVIRYPSDKLEQVIEQINQTGYGLTLGIHSRVQETIAAILSKAKVGNAYVNRNMVGAVVGVQPFGGEGLSGTGPKAGGPNYLQRLCNEKTLSINTTAAGGNASLMSMSE